MAEIARFLPKWQPTNGMIFALANGVPKPTKNTKSFVKIS